MAALDASIINIALPSLTKQFHASMQEIEWVSLVYLLCLAALIVPFGRLADMVGRRWMYATGFSIFIVGSLFCGLSTTFAWLLISRVFQAIGAAMLQSNSISIVTAAVPAILRGKAIGIQAAAQGVGLSLGPFIGGVLLAYFNWRFIFFVNLPIGIIGTIAGILLLPKDINRCVREGFDFLGALCLAPTIVLVIFILNMGQREGWSSPLLLVCYALTIIGTASFIFVEKRTKYPIIDLSLFVNRAFSLGSMTGVLSFAVMYAVTLLAPFYLDDIRHMSILHAGFYLTMVPIGLTLFTPISGAIADRFGTRLPTMLGMASAALGSVLLAFMGATSTLAFMIIGLFLVGVGLGVFTPPNNSSVMGCVPLNRLGVAGGILNMSRTLGMSFGVILGGLSYQVILNIQMRGLGRPTSHQMVIAYHGAFVVAACIALATLVLSAIRANPLEKSQQLAE